MLTIAMYHYVRDLPRTRFPGIKGLLTARFAAQVEYITRRYSVVGVGDVIAAARGADLPANACLLTFDDGLRDHYETVYPILRAWGLPAGFYPPAQAVEERVVLDVHKIHFLLAVVGSGRLTPEIVGILGARGRELFDRFARPRGRDPAGVAFIKRVLQRELPAPERRAIVDRLFRRYVTANGTGFADALYVTVEELRTMARHGMAIGGHGYAHPWLEELPSAEQREEIERTRAFLRRVGGDHDWVMCYPYGSYNQTTLDLLSATGAVLGLTTRPGGADLRRPLELARRDTNDLPFSDRQPTAPVAAEAPAGVPPT